MAAKFSTTSAVLVILVLAAGLLVGSNAIMAVDSYPEARQRMVERDLRGRDIT
ncbi:MAG: hypothetical protein JRI50_09865, partial [Deltaproteobacteria bacterium]|nr:hypothetical protein [Deltaproteobacteria bacterium]MBW1987508.1 hypothetical protein [Deltaproteobacteria bacterium]